MPYQWNAHSSPAIWTIQPRRAAAQVSPMIAPDTTRGRAGGVAIAGALIGAHSTMASTRLGVGEGHSLPASFGLGEEGDREGRDRRGIDRDRERQQRRELQRQHAEHPDSDGES